ncbi:short chain dehydrogenase reductase [Hypoxylon trugodes]|uniref:short chain dehydrogenase reductase n=1 Tax=Hypoxylon trugodes TaxID=326681 RepID=UPI00218E8981|nr:short chain dehydrogenase reductase [Hypoxylon trugodes]KAI1393083.1 short chain dehydrogenase reductase [Hypoxylon trugodes]
MSLQGFLFPEARQFNMVLSTHPNPSAPVLTHFSLAGKTALVTGGTRGIGLEVARGLVEAGCSGVAITYANTDSIEADRIALSISESIAGTPKIIAYKCNVKSKEAVVETVERAARELGGKLDIVVANAGIADHIAAIDYPEDKFREMIDVNFHGVFWTAQAAAKVMESQWKAADAKSGEGRGSIIITASVSAILVNIPQRQAAYNASKAAVVHLAKSLAVEWTEFARVNCVSPGFIATDMLSVHPEQWRKQWFQMIPGGRLCEAAELKGSYVFLASDASSYMTGSNMVIDGGYTLP